MALKVTDVQQMLRKFAENGHDVLTDPRKAHINGKPYGMAVGHELSIYPSFGDSKVEPFLHSHLLQAEAPLVSTVVSSESRPSSHPNVSSVTRDVFPQTRYARDNSYQHASSLPHGYHMDFQFGGEGGQWEPHHVKGDPDTSNYADIHEALASHVNGGVRPEQMTPEQNMSFDESKALRGLVGPAKPFSGQIKVRHVKDDYSQDHYVYHPETEQLLKHENFKSDNDSIWPPTTSFILHSRWIS